MAIGVCLLVVALVVVTVVDRPRRKTWAGLLLGFCVAGILAVTLLGGEAGYVEVNLVPGHTILAALTEPDDPSDVFFVVGNVAMFVPLGWLVALLVRRFRVLKAVVAGFLLSTSIEVTQLFVGRVSDVDDVILNTLGALLGACLSLLFRAVVGGSRGAVRPQVTRRKS